MLAARSGLSRSQVQNTNPTLTFHHGSSVLLERPEQTCNKKKAPYENVCCCVPQVSNWFINARVRLWKPMIEEMYEELKRSSGRGDAEHQSSKDVVG